MSLRAKIIKTGTIEEQPDGKTIFKNWEWSLAHLEPDEVEIVIESDSILGWSLDELKAKAASLSHEPY